MEFEEAFLLEAAILVCGGLTLFIGFRASRLGSPVWAIFGRWTRLAFIAGLAASTFRLFEWSGYPFHILFGVFGLAYFLLETSYNWIAISALSKSDLPLFPRYEESATGEEWPSEPAFIALRDWLRSKGFQRNQALKATIGETLLMRVSSYDSADKGIRLNILILPNEKGSSPVCASFLSTTASGTTLLTDNVFLPFGGFYPESWRVERRPWTRSFDKLLERHQARLDAIAEPLQPFATSPAEQIRKDQQELEQLNRDLGFLTASHETEELGHLTPAGKARVWQEVWTLAYLGRSLAY